ncbi:MAG: hypothetical protein ACRDAX_00265 [Propionibacteriaceae bacterium]
MNTPTIEKLADSLYRQRVMVPMRDGICLATDIYFLQVDASDAPRPTIFERTPYWVRKVRDSDQDAPG